MSSNRPPVSHQCSSKDAHVSSRLKTLQPGQSTKEEVLGRDLVQELSERELQVAPSSSSSAVADLMALSAAAGDRDSEVENLSDGNQNGRSEESEDETEELLRELEKIRREKEAQRIQRQKLDEERRLKANPLLQQDTSHLDDGAARIKRQWNDECIFRSQAKPPSLANQSPLFVNDILRSERHRKFMGKYFK